MIVREHGHQCLAYIDESGFEPGAHRTHGWAPRGRKVFGERSGKSRPRTTLIAARHRGRLAAPMLFEGTTSAGVFNLWLETQLFRELPGRAVLVMDNAAFHKTPETRRIVREAGHRLLYLPPYSPDLNPVEHDFANLKRRRRNAPRGTTLDEVVRMYSS